MSPRSPRSPSLVAPVLALLLLSLAPAAAAAQSARNPTVSRGVPRTSEADSPAKMSIRIGSRDYAFTGAARCVHAPRAALFSKPGKNWTVQVRPDGGSGLRSFALTLWRFDDAATPQAFTLQVQADAASHRISTVQGDAGHGEGTASFAARAGGSGHIEVTGKTAKGTPIRATIDCARFTAPYAVGG